VTARPFSRRVRRALARGSPCLLAGLIAASHAARAEPRCLDTAKVCLEARETPAGVSFVVANHEAAPYSARIVITERENLEPRSPLPFRAVLEPGEERPLGLLAVRDAAKPTRYAMRWSAALGVSTARHDASVRYRMPFGGGEARRLSQGDGGASHRGPAIHSLDFEMPWGTPVLAARGGRVVTVVDGLSAGGLRRDLYDQANRVEILHVDGTLATYAHLRQGAAVKVGQQVATGDLLGYSGDTGYSSGPHLHFMVWKREADLSWTSLPVRFFDGTPQGMVPAQGVAYAPACASTGAGCAPGETPPAPEPVPAKRADAGARGLRRTDGACVCGNGAVIYVDLPCEQVCAR
jgi:murein DD-endopeptidase MepM/ murein hydrolase activator NlpD